MACLPLKPGKEWHTAISCKGPALDLFVREIVRADAVVARALRVVAYKQDRDVDTVLPKLLQVDFDVPAKKGIRANAFGDDKRPVPRDFLARCHFSCFDVIANGIARHVSC